MRCQWAVAGPGRASRRRAEQSSRRGRRAGGPLPTGTPGSPAPQLGVTVPGTPAVLQATLRGPPPAGTPSSPARQAARHAKQPGTPSSPAPQLGVTVPGAPVESHTTAGNQPEYAASSVARWTPPRPASWAAWVRHEKPSARYTASGCASSVGSSECDATATDKS